MVIIVLLCPPLKFRPLLSLASWSLMALARWIVWGQYAKKNGVG
jgi:hypothetical protein